MTTGRINQVATLSKPITANALRTVETVLSSRQRSTTAPAKQVGVFGYCKSSNRVASAEAVAQRLAGLLRIPIEPSSALANVTKTIRLNHKGEHERFPQVRT